MPSNQSIKQLAVAIGHDMAALEDRMAWLETHCCGSQQNQAIAMSSLPALSDQLILKRQTESVSDNALGFVDLRLGQVAWSTFDMLWTGKDLLLDDTLQTAITISLFTDARHNGQKGWWGDDYRNPGDAKIAGSLLWTLLGKPSTQENVRIGQQYAEEALQWLVDDGYAESIDVHTEYQRRSLDTLAIGVAVTHYNKAIGHFQF